MANTTFTMIKVWTKIDNNEPEKVEIRSDADIDDLKSELFVTNKEEKRRYYGIFNKQKLASSARVPDDTTDERPILFVKIHDNAVRDYNDDEDTVRVTTTDLFAVPTKESTGSSSTTSMAQNSNKIRTSVTSSTVTDPAIIVTTSDLPPHLVETKHYENGDKYVGEINEREEPHGKGTMYWKNGRRYEGYWKNGKKNGLGVEYGANGALNFNGEWRDDTLVSPDDNDH